MYLLIGHKRNINISFNAKCIDLQFYKRVQKQTNSIIAALFLSDNWKIYI